jgi:hypothetical protein
MKKIAAAFGLLLAFAPGAFAPGAFAAAPAAPIPQPAVSSASVAVSSVGTPTWLPATITGCSGNCNVYCGSGAIDRYYEQVGPCCSHDSCNDGSLFLWAVWQPPTGCWGGGECAVP